MIRWDCEINSARVKSCYYGWGYEIIDWPNPTFQEFGICRNCHGNLMTSHWNSYYLNTMKPDQVVVKFPFQLPKLLSVFWSLSRLSCGKGILNVEASVARGAARYLDILWPEFSAVDSSSCSLPTPACVCSISKKNVCDGTSNC